MVVAVVPVALAVSNYSLLTSCTEHLFIIDLFYPLPLPNGMTLVLRYVISNPLVLLKKLYFPFTMCLLITLLMILLLIDLMQFSILVYI